MANAQDLVTAHFFPIQAELLGDSLNATVTAAGTTQGTATLLTATNNIVTTATAVSALGVIPPASPINPIYTIINATAETIDIYPPSGAKFNNGSANAAVTLATGVSCILKRFSSTVWSLTKSA